MKWWEQIGSGSGQRPALAQRRSVYEDMYAEAPEEDRVPWRKLGEVDPATGQWIEPPDLSAMHGSGWRRQ